MGADSPRKEEEQEKETLEMKAKEKEQAEITCQVTTRLIPTVPNRLVTKL
jgi:hypothetical protein